MSLDLIPIKANIPVLGFSTPTTESNSVLHQITLPESGVYDFYFAPGDWPKDDRKYESGELRFKIGSTLKIIGVENNVRYEAIQYDVPVGQQCLSAICTRLYTPHVAGLPDLVVKTKPVNTANLAINMAQS